MDDSTQRLVQDRIRDLYENSDFAQALFDHLADYAIIAADFDGNILAYNQGARLIYGYAPNEVIGIKTIDSFFPKHFVDSGIMQYIVADLIGKGACTYEGEKVRRDGRIFPAHVNFTLTKNKNGQAIGFIEIAQDLTERKRAEEKILRLNGELEHRVEERTAEAIAARNAAMAASAAKSDFLANMSHEIRTPLNAIIGIADLLNETGLDKEQKKFVRIFSQAGQTLLNLVNDILDLSKIEAGKLDLEEVEFNLREVAEAASEIMAIRAREKGLELACWVGRDVPETVKGDPSRLRQVMINLLGNAIKFTSAGEVVLRLERDPGDSQLLRFSVCDTGIGIPADKIDRIFEDFTQADSTITRKYGGTGLGLSISKRIAQRMGGRIWAESEVGRGSIFRFTARLPIIKDKPEAQPSFSGVTALVIDENASNRSVIREILAPLGADVLEAARPIEALDAVSKAKSSGSPVSFALIDSGLSQSDACNLAKDLQSRWSIPLVLTLAPDIHQKDILLAKNLGVSTYLVKPVKHAELVRAAAIALGRIIETAPAQAEKETFDPLGRELKILLAEDSDDNQTILTAYLQGSGSQVDVAANGLQALERFKASHYDLVLMDVQMPTMDGYSATKAIRDWEKEMGRPPTPILALTAHALVDDKLRSLEAGCTGHLSKPIRKETLLKAVREYTKTGEPPAPSKTNGGGRVKVEVQPELRHLVPKFLANRRKDIEELETAAAAGDFACVDKIGHRLKGISGYDFMPVNDIGKRLQDAASHRDADAVRREIEGIRAMLERLDFDPV